MVFFSGYKSSEGGGARAGEGVEGAVIEGWVGGGGGRCCASWHCSEFHNSLGSDHTSPSQREEGGTKCTLVTQQYTGQSLPSENLLFSRGQINF